MADAQLTPICTSASPPGDAERISRTPGIADTEGNRVGVSDAGRLSQRQRELLSCGDGAVGFLVKHPLRREDRPLRNRPAYTLSLG